MSKKIQHIKVVVPKQYSYIVHSNKRGLLSKHWSLRSAEESIARDILRCHDLNEEHDSCVYERADHTQLWKLTKLKK
jgi:hypothetical protein